MKTIPHTRSIERRIQHAKKQPKSYQVHRLVDHLYFLGPTSTGELSHLLQIGNLSHAANQIRPHLLTVGLAIVADLPKPLKRNKCGDPSMAREWRLVELR